MNYLKTLAFGLLLGSGSIWAECVAPEAPSLPNGAKASYDDMIDGQKAVKAFQEENEKYRSCVEEDIAATKAVAKDKDASDEAKTAAVARHSKAVESYNAAVTREEEVAGKYNSQIQAYQAANAE